MKTAELHWKAAYDTGVEEIDLQHRYFLALINRLRIELDGCDDATYRRRLLDELARYAAFHFISEENLMLKFGYPGYEQQRRLHLELIDQLSWRMQSPSHGDLFDFLIGWFVHHTVEEDHGIGEFVRGLKVS
jgi:hemerythrin